MGFTKPIEQSLFSNSLIKIYVFVYLKDIIREENNMKTRQEALAYALTFPNTYIDTPFHDPNWQLVKSKENKKVFLWTYERDGYINLNVKVSSAWRDFWRDAFPSVIPG